MCKKLTKTQKAVMLKKVEEKTQALEDKLDHILNGGNPARQTKATKK